MNRQRHPIEIGEHPELIRLVEEVRTEKTPRVLRHHNRDVAFLVPIDDTPLRAVAHSTDEVVERLRLGFGAVVPISRPEDFREARLAFEQGVAEEVAPQGRT